MSVSDDYIDFVIDQLSPLGDIAVKRMFGGAGLYCGGLFFALIEDNTLRFKVDETNRADFEEAGMEPFKPYKDKKQVMQYYEVPIEVLEDRHALGEWGEKALNVARNSRKRRRNKTEERDGHL